ncbi:hypothetical protein ABK040_016493 [Willaertia magna]
MLNKIKSTLNNATASNNSLSSNGKSNKEEKQSISKVASKVVENDILDDDLFSGMDGWASSDDESEEEVDERNLLENIPETWRQAKQVEDLLERIQLHRPKTNVKPADIEIDKCEDPLDIIKNLQKPKLKNGLHPFEDGFIPTKYLATFHHHVPFETLRKGRLVCRKRKEQQSQKLRLFVQDNLERYIYLKDKLEEFFLGKEDKNIFNDAAVKRLESTFDNIQKSGYALFKPMIDTKIKQEEVRTIVNIVDKLKFLLTIPSDIKENIERKEYKKIVMDYKKAKYFLKQSNSGLMRKLFGTITESIEGVRSILFSKLKDPEVPQDQKERLIGYLYMLDAKEEDPVWFYIRNQYNYIIDKMQEMFDSAMEFHKLYTKQNKEKKNIFSVVGRKEMERKIAIEDEEFLLPNNESLISKEERPNTKNMELYRKRQREKQIKKEAEIESLFIAIHDIFSAVIKTLFDSMDNGNFHQPHMIEALQLFLEHMNALTAFKIPKKFIAPLYTFVQDMKNDIIERLCERTMESIKSLYLHEDWKFIRESNTTRIAIYAKQYLFNLINILSSIMHEMDNFENVKQLFIEALLCFGDSIYKLTSTLEESPDTDKKYLMLLCNCCSMFEEGGVIDKTVTMLEDKILSIEVNDDLDDLDFDDIDLDIEVLKGPSITKGLFKKECKVQEVYNKYRELSNLIQNKYIRRKVTSISHFFSKGIPNSEEKWSKATLPTTIRSYIIEVLLGVSVVHHETLDFRAKKDLPQEICRELKFGLLQSFNEYIRRIDCLNVYGALQLDIEFTFFNDVLIAFDTEDIVNLQCTIIQKFIEISPSLDFEANLTSESSEFLNVKNTLLNNYKEKTALQFACFKYTQTPQLIRPSPSLSNIKNMKKISSKAKIEEESQVSDISPSLGMKKKPTVKTIPSALPLKSSASKTSLSSSSSKTSLTSEESKTTTNPTTTSASSTVTTTNTTTTTKPKTLATIKPKPITTLPKKTTTIIRKPTAVTASKKQPTATDNNETDEEED